MHHEELLEKVVYNAETGVFKRRKSAGNVKAGSLMGYEDAKGYLRAYVGGRHHRLHRLAWFYTHGRWPMEQLDHINGDRKDNRICNLRECNTQLNCLYQKGPRSTNKVGYQGVHKIGEDRYRCSLRGKHIGVFNTPEEAHLKYLEIKNQLLEDYDGSNID